jgi:hypothetical protein
MSMQHRFPDQVVRADHDPTMTGSLTGALIRLLSPHPGTTDIRMLWLYPGPNPIDRSHPDEAVRSTKTPPSHSTTPRYAPSLFSTYPS